MKICKKNQCPQWLEQVQVLDKTLANAIYELHQIRLLRKFDKSKISTKQLQREKELVGTITEQASKASTKLQSQFFETNFRSKLENAFQVLWKKLCTRFNDELAKLPEQVQSKNPKTPLVGQDINKWRASRLKKETQGLKEELASAKETMNALDDYLNEEIRKKMAHVEDELKNDLKVAVYDENGNLVGVQSSGVGNARTQEEVAFVGANLIPATDEEYEDILHNFIFLKCKNKECERFGCYSLSNEPIFQLFEIDGNLPPRLLKYFEVLTSNGQVFFPNTSLVTLELSDGSTQQISGAIELSEDGLNYTIYDRFRKIIYGPVPVLSIKKIEDVLFIFRNLENNPQKKVLQLVDRKDGKVHDYPFAIDAIYYQDENDQVSSIEKDSLANVKEIKALDFICGAKEEPVCESDDSIFAQINLLQSQVEQEQLLIVELNNDLRRTKTRAEKSRLQTFVNDHEISKNTHLRQIEELQNQLCSRPPISKEQLDAYRANKNVPDLLEDERELEELVDQLDEKETAKERRKLIRVGRFLGRGQVEEEREEEEEQEEEEKEEEEEEEVLSKSKRIPRRVPASKRTKEGSKEASVEDSNAAFSRYIAQIKSSLSNVTELNLLRSKIATDTSLKREDRFKLQSLLFSIVQNIKPLVKNVSDFQLSASLASLRLDNATRAQIESEVDALRKNLTLGTNNNNNNNNNQSILLHKNFASNIFVERKMGSDELDESRRIILDLVNDEHLNNLQKLSYLNQFASEKSFLEEEKNQEFFDIVEKAKRNILGKDSSNSSSSLFHHKKSYNISTVNKHEVKEDLNEDDTRPNKKKKGSASIHKQVVAIMKRYPQGIASDTLALLVHEENKKDGLHPKHEKLNPENKQEWNWWRAEVRHAVNPNDDLK